MFFEAAAHGRAVFRSGQEVRPGQELDANPLFNVVVSHSRRNFQVYSAAEITSGNFVEDLRFSFEDHGEQLCGAITYATDLFDRTTITGIAQHWQNLLAPLAQIAKPVSKPSAS